MTTRTDERLQALGCILSDGLTYCWFRVIELDVDAATATLDVDTGDYDGDDNEIFKRVEIGPDDIARGLRMYGEYMAGTREQYEGEFKHSAADAVRAGLIKDVSEFVPGVHNRASVKSYGWQTVEFDKTNGRDGDYDANTADSVLQFATLGYAIFG